MKIVYKAEDGTEFDKESNCKEYEIACAETKKSEEELENKLIALIDLAENVTHTWEDIPIDSRAGANFIIENIQKINEILGYKVESEVVFTSENGTEYKAIPETCSCKGCTFNEHPYDYCSKSSRVFDCEDNNIIWIKK